MQLSHSAGLAKAKKLSDLPAAASVNIRNLRYERGAPAGLPLFLAGHGGGYLQRSPSTDSSGADAASTAGQMNAAVLHERGSGQPLDAGIRGQMESAFGADFSGVRVHTGPNADAINRAVSSVAFTTGEDVFFRSGEYHPGSPAGITLLAHELAHVVQQNGSSSTGALEVGEPGDQYEQEAEQAANFIARSLNDRAVSASAHTAAKLTAIKPCGCGARSEAAGECAECRQRNEAPVPIKAVGLNHAGLVQTQVSSRLQRQTITDLPGTDYDSCVEQTDEDTARLMDTINTACSIKGAAFALGGGAIGAFAGPIGAGIGAVAGGMYGAYNYGKCVEEQNASARAGAKVQKAECAKKFKPAINVNDLPDATPAESKPINVNDLPNADGSPNTPIPTVNVEDLPKAQ